MSDRVLTKPDYGQDAPGIVRTLLVLGPLLLIFAAWNPLAPGGQVALSDFQKTSDYADDLREAGMANAKVSGPVFAVFPPLRIVTGTKT